MTATLLKNATTANNILQESDTWLAQTADSHKNRLVARWLIDENFRLYCRWVIEG